MNNNNNKQKSKAMRRAQSQRDKANAKAGGQPSSRQQRRRPMRDNGDDQTLVFGMNDGQLRTQLPRKGVIEKRELITLVNGTVAFGVQKYALNPGLPLSFPIGSAEAKNWTEWRCTKLRVDYIPTVSQFATQGQTGEVAIAVDYNAENRLPTLMSQVEAMHFAGGGIPSKGFAFEAVPKLLNKSDPKYVRIGPVSASEDLRLYDGGNLYFATSGCTNATQIGKLEVTYRFEVNLPTLLNEGVAGDDDRDIAYFQSSAAETTGATTVATNLLAATAVTNGLVVVNTAGSMVPPVGNYYVDVFCNIGTTGNTTKLELDVMKNAVSVYAGATLHPTNVILATALTSAALYASVYVEANGTDAFTFKYTQTGGSAATSWGSVRWVLA